MKDAYSYNRITISNIYSLCRDIETSGNPYGLTSASNSHQMKNSEWGAVAYLAQSKYGRNGNEISINSGFWTGAGGNNSSTTGNVYGIFDISGGVFKYTAGYLNNNDPNLLTYGKSMVGLNADNVVDGIATKYISLYNVGTSDTSTENYNANNTRVGEAIWETSAGGNGEESWYGDFSSFYSLLSSVSEFLLRGGCYGDDSDAGAFAFFSYGGCGDDVCGFRAVLCASSL